MSRHRKLEAITRFFALANYEQTAPMLRDAEVRSVQHLHADGIPANFCTRAQVFEKWLATFSLYGAYILHQEHHGPDFQDQPEKLYDQEVAIIIVTTSSLYGEALAGRAPGYECALTWRQPGRCQQLCS